MLATAPSGERAQTLLCVSRRGNRFMRTRPLAFLLIAVALALLPRAASASCRQECQPAIARCVGAGYRRAACRRLLVKVCRRSGPTACDVAFLPTTTTTAPPSSPTPTTTLPPPPPAC